MTIQVTTWTLDEIIDSLPDSETRFDYWPWPEIKLLNDPGVVRAGSLWSKAADQMERTS